MINKFHSLKPSGIQTFGSIAVPDSVKMEITIAYPERNIMECTLVVIVFSVNAGKVINTQRKVVEAVRIINAVQVLDLVCSS